MDPVPATHNDTLARRTSAPGRRHRPTSTTHRAQTCANAGPGALPAQVSPTGTSEPPSDRHIGATGRAVNGIANQPLSLPCGLFVRWGSDGSQEIRDASVPTSPAAHAARRQRPPDRGGPSDGPAQGGAVARAGPAARVAGARPGAAGGGGSATRFEVGTTERLIQIRDLSRTCRVTNRVFILQPGLSKADASTLTKPDPGVLTKS